VRNKSAPNWQPHGQDMQQQQFKIMADARASRSAKQTDQKPPMPKRVKPLYARATSGLPE